MDCMVERSLGLPQYRLQTNGRATLELDQLETNWGLLSSFISKHKIRSNLVRLKLELLSIKTLLP